MPWARSRASGCMTITTNNMIAGIAVRNVWRLIGPMEVEPLM